MTIRDDATRALARVDALHTALTHLVLEGGDLRQIAAEAADVLGVGGAASPRPTAANGPRR